MNPKFRPPPPGSSFSDQFLQSKASSAPVVSASMAKNVSEYRRGVMQDEVSQGIFRDGSSGQYPFGAEGNMSKMGLATYSTSGIKKNAQVLSSGLTPGTATPGALGGGGSAKQIPEIYSPLWLTSNLNLPRDRATINAWCRAFFALNPFVHNAINLHSTYPISKLNIKCADKNIEKFFNDMIEEIGLMNICVQVGMEYWLLGEAFIYSELDQHNGKWRRLLIQNPDYMVVNRTVVADEPIIMLRPDQNLKRIVSSNKPADIEQRKQLNNYIIDAVKRGQNIPMNNFNVSHLARKISPYEIRGTGLPVSIFRQLMLFDTLYESKFVQAMGMINPLTIVKVGGDANENLHPTAADLEAWRDVFAAVQFDKDAKIFTHAGIAVERVGYNQGILDINPDIQEVIKQIYVGLMTPPVLAGDGADTTYANGGVALDVLRQRYMSFRNMLALWLKKKIFAPISEIQGFYERKEGKKELIIPEVDWNHMSLFDAGDYTQNLITLSQAAGQGEQPRVSEHTLYRSLGLEWEDEKRKLRKEAIQRAIAAKETEALGTMGLNELRSITDEDEILEPANAQTQEQPVPGETPGLGGGSPDLGLGGLPGLETPPMPTPGTTPSPAAPVPPTPTTPPATPPPAGPPPT